jgi:hypothetical protein
MSIIIEPYRKEHEPAVEAFNRRLQAGGEEIIFFRQAEHEYLSKIEGSGLYQEQFVAVEDGAVRGGYALKRQSFSFSDGTVRSIGYYHHCLSEGIINQAYARVGSILLMHAMRQEQMLYCLGMGGYDRPLPKMLVRLGWGHCLIPFYLRVLRPYRFLREMEGLQTSSVRRMLMDFGAMSGAGWVGLKALRTVEGIRSPRVTPFSVEEFDEFSDWTDPLWEGAKDNYGMVAVRDAANLRVLYPASFVHLTKLKVSQNSSVVGWAVVGERRKNPRWGDLRVGTIIDCWAAPGDELAVIRAATANLEESGLDAIVSNQSHHTWCRAVENSGFLKTSSNFVFAASKKLGESLQPFEQEKSRMHLVRGDGDGLPWAY